MSRPIKRERSLNGMPPTSTPRAFPAKHSLRMRPKVERPADVPPAATYSDYRLISSGSRSLKFNVVKFNSLRDVDPTTFVQPVKMNRKDPRGPPPVEEQPSPDGVKMESYEFGFPGSSTAEEERKPVLDSATGKPVLDADGQPIYTTSSRAKFDASLVAPHGGGPPVQQLGKNKKMAFRKKTKQVFKISTETIRLRREERHPWVVESGDRSDEWVGRMEDKAENARYCLFVFEDDKDEFEVLDVRRWFKFQPKPKYGTLAAEEAEELYARTLKGKDTGRWMMREDDRTPSAGSDGPHSRSSSSRLPNAPHQGISLPTSRAKRDEALPGWLRRATTVAKIEHAGMVVKREPGLDEWDLGEGESGGRGRREDGAGVDGDGDADFEDAFSDDDGLIEFDQTDEQENKELEERLKREFRQGNAQGEDAVSDEEDLFGDDALDENGKRIKKTLKKHKKRRGAEDSEDEDDDGRNPYASSEESESSDEEPEPINPQTNPANGPVTMINGMHVPPPPPSRTNAASTNRQPSNAGTTSNSRAASPVPSGAAFLAHRATTPNRKPRVRDGSRERSGSPIASGANKRKGESESGTPVASSAEGAKKARVDEQAGEAVKLVSTGPKEAQVISYLKRTKPSIGQLISHFKKSLKSTNPDQTAANKAYLLDVVKRVANLDKDMTIVLKEGYA